MLKMPMSIMDMVNVVAVRDLLAVVVISVRRAVIGVNFRLRVAFSVVDVVDVVAVDDRLVPVTRKVLVVAGFSVVRRRHFHSFGSRACRSAVIDVLGVSVRSGLNSYRS